MTEPDLREPSARQRNDMVGECASEVSVIIPVYNGGSSFGECLSSLAATAPAPREIIVVDDCSTDDSARAAAGSGATLLRTEVRSGPAHARNLGAKQACGDILLFLDADVTVRPDIIGQVTETFCREPSLSALFGSYDDAPAAANFLSQYKNLMHHYVHQAAREDAFTFWAGCGAIWRETFLSLDGFDDGYRVPAIEDIELGYRLRRAGHRIRLIKTLQVKHLKSWRPLSLLRSDFAQRALPWAELILRQRSAASDLNLGWSSRFSVSAVYALAGALLAAWNWPVLWAAAGVLALALLALNWPLYNFFRRKRGVLFALGAIPWHWFYYLYGGLGFALAAAKHLVTAIGLHSSSDTRAGGEEPGCSEETRAP